MAFIETNFEIIQTFYLKKNKYGIIDNYTGRFNLLELIYASLLSSFLLKSHYGKVVLYCNSEFKDVINKYDHFYDNIITYHHDNLEFNLDHGMFKLETFRNQTTPFVHFDFDTFLFKPIDFLKYRNFYKFAHRDILFLPHNTSNEVLLNNYLLQKYISNYKSIYGYTITQIANYLDILFDNTDASFLYLLDYVDVRKIPNMNITYVKNYDIFKSATNMSIDFFCKRLNQNSKHNISVFVEQMLIPLFLSKIDPIYHKSDDVFLYNNPTFFLENTNEVNILDNILINSNDELYSIKFDSYADLLNFDFNGNLHLAHYKNNIFFKELLLYKLITIFGIDYVKNINKVYFKKYKTENKMIDILKKYMLI